MIPDISIIVPLYNEEKVFNSLIEELNRVIQKNHEIKFEVILIDDGSSDDTCQLMSSQALLDSRYIALSLSRNFGHQIAVSAGLKYASATKGCFIIDGDLQDPPELVYDFYSKFLEGYDVVYGVRKKRKEGIIKKAMYKIFYKFLSSISDIKLPVDSGDFSFISTRVKDIMINMPEESRYLRGMRAWVGFKQYSFEYERSKREAGESKYSFKLLLKLAYNGIFNFSSFPIKFITNLGLLTLIIAGSFLVFTFIKKLFYGSVPSGFTSLAALIVMFGSIQLICIGVIGEYVIRIFYQSKERPMFLVDFIIQNKERRNG
jgi:glycosyltransferase involved in cell wall biosynthesis